MENKHKLQTLLDHLEVFQICDSTFPIGTFNHSFGMENYLHDRRIKKAPEFQTWFENYFKSQFKYGEGLLTVLCWRALEKDELEKLWEYDDIITNSTLALETRNGQKLIAKQMLALIKRMYGTIKPLDTYEARIKAGESAGSPAIVFTIFAKHQKLSLMDTFMMYGYSIGSTMVQNAVRAIPLGQRDGQVVLHDVIALLGDLYPVVKKLDEAYLGANVPGLELAQIKHETQGSRLFMS
ncbi:urease accessory protein UreF [Ligilactobacillus faecis]|uniref:urease accessory protein UreF n=1 Tax=Ligilactobacillus faecis TaxID=762833 RepID=UPI002468625D|nr:urease accessory protein UreF [Ligilactobacillus faecis]WGN90024.1 urease accessory protein UreF [Ligilactobacillus faecis]